MNKNRLCIYPKDITLITGKGIRHAQKLLRTIRTALDKEAHQAVSIADFAAYMGLDEEDVAQSILPGKRKDDGV